MGIGRGCFRELQYIAPLVAVSGLWAGEELAPQPILPHRLRGSENDGKEWRAASHFSEDEGGPVKGFWDSMIFNCRSRVRDAKD